MGGSEANSAAIMLAAARRSSHAGMCGNIHVRMYLQEGSLDPVLASFLVRMFI